ncbi:MAG: hypothetical protein JW717_07785 [Marinilabiliaceae bacterium]|nr:hypothetical protein [Marinilabiliaceae bacterium]
MMSRFFLIACLSVVFLSCEKGAGEGGNATITGSVMVHEWDENFIAKRGEHPAYAEDVYIVYGNDDFYGDKVETHMDGSFKFEYLREGRYTIFVYSKDTLDPSNQIIVSKTVEVTGKNQTVKVPEFVIVNDNGDNGIYSITGKVIIDQYSDDYDSLIYTAPAHELDVYIQREGEDFYFDRIRTDANGTYKFGNLIAGEYIVFAFGKDPDMINGETMAVEQHVSVVENQTTESDNDPFMFIMADMHVKENDGNEGTSVIKGVIIMEEWNGTFTLKRDEYPAEEENVYIMRLGDDFYLNRIDTDFDGRYNFSGLSVGTYLIYAYSKDPKVDYNISNKMMIITDTLEISMNGQVALADTIRIKN